MLAYLFKWPPSELGDLNADELAFWTGEARDVVQKLGAQ